MKLLRITAFSNLGAQLVGVPQHATGIDLDALDETWTRVTGEGRRVAFLYVVPNFQNPSGVLMDRATRAGPSICSSPLAMSSGVTERSNAATEERLKSGHAVGGVSIL